MTEPLTCPCGCGQRQDAGLLAATCTDKLERQLGDVRSIVQDLQTTVSKQARIGVQSGGAGLARERSPIHFGAVEVADNLRDVLSVWAHEVWADKPFTRPVRLGTETAARIMLANIDHIRRHVDVAKLVDEVADAVEQARRVVDRPADKVFLGPCRGEGADEYGQQVLCQSELYARPEATEARCKVCGYDVVVADQQLWLLEQAADILYTVPEAARMVGTNGGMKITQQWIWNQIHKGKRLAYRPGTKRIRLGDLLEILADDRVRQAA